MGDDTEENSSTSKFVFFPGFVLCIEMKSYAAYIFYGWTMSHNTVIPFLYNNGKSVYHMIQIQQYLLGIMHILDCNYFDLEDIPLFITVADRFSSPHHLFIIISHLQRFYS